MTTRFITALIGFCCLTAFSQDTPPPGAIHTSLLAYADFSYTSHSAISANALAASAQELMPVSRKSIIINGSHVQLTDKNYTSIYTAAGKKVVCCNGPISMNLPTGVYLLRSGAIVKKIVIP